MTIITIIISNLLCFVVNNALLYCNTIYHIVLLSLRIPNKNDSNNDNTNNTSDINDNISELDNNTNSSNNSGAFEEPRDTQLLRYNMILNMKQDSNNTKTV